MTISSLYIKNFKGISDGITFRITPITLFLGPNSSGKSSAIHALAAMAQTAKLGGRSAPLILDDDAAHVHLGRFIEIVHSKTYKDHMTIGLGLGPFSISLPAFDPKQQAPHEISGDLNATYTFGSSKRTQELFIASAEFSVGARELKITSSKGKFKLTDSGTGKTHVVTRVSNFTFEIEWGKGARSTGWVETMYILRMVQNKINESILKTLYLGPFRQSPRRRYQVMGSMPNEVGSQGEAAISMLASEHVQHKRRPHIAQIARWLKILGLGTSVNVARVGTSDLFGVDITLQDSASLPIADLGYGVSQVLPVLAQCSFAKAGSTLLFEQPELHLHPGAAARLAEIFAEVVSKRNIHLVIETHSKDFFLEIFRLLREKKISLSDISAYDVKREDSHSVYQSIEITEADGEFEVTHPWFKGLQN